jgi:quercetin dioxygenase-like cupin family protein
MQSSLPRPWFSSAWLISLVLAGVSSALPARAVDDGHGGAAQGVRVETLAKSDQAWNGERLPPYPSAQPLVSVLRITIPAGVTLARHHHPVINAGVLLQGRLEVISDQGERLELKAGDALIEVVNQVHYGKSLGPEPAVIVVVYAGAQGVPTTVRDSAPKTSL